MYINRPYPVMFADKPIVSKEVDEAFTLAHVNNVWKEVEKTKLDVNKLIEQVYNRYQEYGKTVFPAKDFFLMWGVKELNPIINKQLGREPHAKTFQFLLEHVLEKEIDSRNRLKNRS